MKLVNVSFLPINTLHAKEVEKPRFVTFKLAAAVIFEIENEVKAELLEQSLNFARHCLSTCEADFPA